MKAEAPAFPLLPKERAAGALALCAVVLAVLVAMLASQVAFAEEVDTSVPADAVDSGPFDVEGPEGSFEWNGDALNITGDGVTILGMVDPTSAASGNVSVASSVSAVALGSDVRIQTLSTAGRTALRLGGDGNEIDVWNMARGLGVSGVGSLSVGEATASLDVLPDATVSIERGADSVSVWGGGTLSVGPQAAIANITQFGGTLDLSSVVFGAPVRVLGYSVGGEGVSSVIVAPFGSTMLSELMTYDHLFVNGGDTAIVEDGERVGSLMEDGTFDITATRTVTFVGFDGEVLSTQTVKLFSSAVAPQVNAPKGYEFVGWDQPFDYITEDLTVEALFEKLPVSGGSDDRPQEGDTGGNVSLTTSGPAGGGSPDAGYRSQYTPTKQRLARTADETPALPALALAVAAGTIATIALLIGQRVPKSTERIDF